MKEEEENTQFVPEERIVNNIEVENDRENA
jgi:hypothetical protein